MKSNYVALASVMERLEGRTLLSAAGSPFNAFGTNGILHNYAVLATQNDGSLIARNSQNKLVVLHPDGTFASNYSGPTPQTVPVQNVQSDGKYLVMKNGALTRYNKNGTMDQTFGTNGTVSNFYAHEPGATVATFHLQAFAVDGTKIFVTGVDDYTLDSNTDSGDQLFVERLTSAGKVDTTFGNHGVAATSSLADLQVSLNVFFMEIGPDHNIYVANDADLDPVVDRFSESGAFQREAFDDGHSEDETVAGISFQRDGKILILTKDDSFHMTLIRYNSNLTIDTTFGHLGEVDPTPPNSVGLVDDTPVALSIRADGTIFASGTFEIEQSNAGGYYTFAYTSQPTASAISGHFFNDANGNGKLDTGEAPLRYWAAYADTNNDGVWEAGEPIAYADYNGYYKFSDLAPGTYIIREVRQDGWTRTTPAGAWPSGDYKVTLGVNQLVGLRDFGNKK